MSDKPKSPPEGEAESPPEVEAKSTPEPETKPPTEAEAKPVEPRTWAIGTEVKRRRQAARMTVEELADRARLTPNYIGTVERGDRDPSLSTLMALANGLNITPGELLRPSMDVGLATREMLLRLPSVSKARRMRPPKGIYARLKALLRSRFQRLRSWLARRRGDE